MFRRLISTSDSRTLTILRMVLGLVFFAHGAQKMLGLFGGYGFHGTMQGFVQSGVPSVLAFLVICAEFFGSLGVFFGFLTRIAAAGICAVMLGAIALVHRHVGFFMNWYGQQKGEGFEYHLLVIAITVVLMIEGAGAASIDRAISQRPSIGR